MNEFSAGDRVERLPGGSPEMAVGERHIVSVVNGRRGIQVQAHPGRWWRAEFFKIVSYAEPTIAVLGEGSVQRIKRQLEGGLIAPNAIGRLSKPISGDTATSPGYYKFPSGAEVRQISSYLTGNGAQALQYIARSTRLDGINKGDRIENLEKALLFTQWEIDRLKAEA